MTTAPAPAAPISVPAEGAPARGFARMKTAAGIAKEVGGQQQSEALHGVVSKIEEKTRGARKRVKDGLKLGVLVANRVVDAEMFAVGVITDPTLRAEFKTASSEMYADAKDVVNAKVEAIKDDLRAKKNWAVQEFKQEMKIVGDFANVHIVKPSRVAVPAGVGLGTAIQYAEHWIPPTLSILGIVGNAGVNAAVTYGPDAAAVAGLTGAATAAGVGLYETGKYVLPRARDLAVRKLVEEPVRAAAARATRFWEQHGEQITTGVNMAANAPRAAREALRETRRQAGNWGDMLNAAVNEQADYFAKGIDQAALTVGGLHELALAAGADVKATFQGELHRSLREGAHSAHMAATERRVNASHILQTAGAIRAAARQ